MYDTTGSGYCIRRWRNASGSFVSSPVLAFLMSRPRYGRGNNHIVHIKLGRFGTEKIMQFLNVGNCSDTSETSISLKCRPISRAAPSLWLPYNSSFSELTSMQRKSITLPILSVLVCFSQRRSVDSRELRERRRSVGGKQLFPGSLRNTMWQRKFQILLEKLLHVRSFDILCFLELDDFENL